MMPSHGASRKPVDDWGTLASLCFSEHTESTYEPFQKMLIIISDLLNARRPLLGSPQEMDPGGQAPPV